MSKVHWKKSPPQSLYFEYIEVGETFKIDSFRSKGAVYMKVHTSHRVSGYPDQYLMLELATGKLFSPTTSRITRVNVDIHVDAEKPEIYDAYGDD